ncbi:MAG: helix-turn-helix domain-containing protein [Gammaproteobacteria bacterium]|nr:helix-turn-helix domain-containing protein [Gammaproteobacteria bacterium]
MIKAKNSKFAGLLLKYMNREGFNSNQLARKIKISRQTVLNWLEGEIRRPNCDAI